MGRGTEGTDPSRKTVREEAIEFLRAWLPQNAQDAYRELIRQDPHNWWRHPHFAGGIIVQHALRGNGIDERALGVRDLESEWPDLLLRALEPGTR